MTANQLRRMLYLAQRTVGDFNAASKGRVFGRVFNRLIGRQANRLMRGVWR